MKEKNSILAALCLAGYLLWLAVRFLSFVVPITLKALDICPTKTIFIVNSDLESQPGVKLLEPNHAYFNIVKDAPEEVHVEWNTDIQAPAVTHVDIVGQGGCIYLPATSADGKSFEVMIDTGFKGYLTVNDVVVMENGLEIQPLKNPDGSTDGFCYIGQLNIAEMKIINPVCSYFKTHYETRKLGRTIWKSRNFLMGLELLKRFKYILVDGRAREVEFSIEAHFGPNPNQVWIQYPMSISSDDEDSGRLMVGMAIGSANRRVQFDTGCDVGLVVSEKIWNSLSGELKVLGKKRGTIRMLKGPQECEYIVVERLSLGDYSANNARICVLSGQSDYENMFLLGVEYFANTTIVIDFEHEKLWVRKRS